MKPNKIKVIPFTMKKDIRALKMPTLFYQNNTGVHRSKITWTNFGQGIAMEGTAGRSHQ
jgi:hypothetical protein